jgi:uncharacterized protein (DUF1800 family)
MEKLSNTSMRILSVILAGLLGFPQPLALAQNMKAGKDKSKGQSATRLLNGEQKAIHLLNRITYGPRSGDVGRVEKMGWEKYLDEQLRPERISDQLVDEKLKNIESIHLNAADMAKYYPQPQVIRELLKSRGVEPPGALSENPGQNQSNNADDQMKRREAMKALAEMGYKPPQAAIQELQQAKILRAVYSERQLQEVMADFWFNHFNVYIQKGADRILTTSYERDAIRAHVFGKFEDLVKATAEHPAMLFYLDNWMSASPNAKRPTRDDLRRMRREQPGGRFGKAKVGIFDQTVRGQGRDNRPNAQLPGDDRQQQMMIRQGRIPNRSRGLNENYAREIMELHTLGVDGGYTQKDVQEVARCFTGWTLRNPRGGAEFFFNPLMHDDGEKTVLGNKISAGGGMKDGYAVIHLLATHPSTAKFISTKLARKFVSDNPPQSLVDRMAKTFQKTDGDIREVLRAMFTAPEFFAAENYRAKIKTPFEMTVSAVRALGADTNGGPQFHRWIAQMGEGLFLCQPPTGYADTAEHWVNTGALLERMNFALALSGNRIPGSRMNLQNLSQSAKTDQPPQVVDHFADLLLHGQISPQTRSTIDKSLSEQQLAMAGRRVDTAKVIGLILGSPEFQRQ